MAKQLPFRQPVFVYGTLMSPGTRFKALGHQVDGTPDVLLGYDKKLDAQGYPYLQKSAGLTPGVVKGLLLDLTTQDLATLDNYEDKRYHRMRVKLQSGQLAWTYDESIQA